MALTVSRGDETSLESCGGLAGSLKCSCALLKEKGAPLLSKAGDRSTSLGMIPLFSRESIPSEMSFSVMGGGSAKGSSRKCFGRMRFAMLVFDDYR